MRSPGLALLAALGGITCIAVGAAASQDVRVLRILRLADGSTTVEGDAADPDAPTVVVTHGWRPIGGPAGAFPMPEVLAAVEARAEAECSADPGGFPGLNLIAYQWPEAFTLEYPRAAGGAEFAGRELSLELLSLGLPCTSCGGSIHFIGHSLGTAVNAYAAQEALGTVAQFTILEAPSRVRERFLGIPLPEFEPAFFQWELSGQNPRSADVSYVDNYYGDEIFPPDFSFGEPIQGAAPGAGLLFDGAGHSEVQSERYADLVATNEWVSAAVLPSDFANRPLPQLWSPPAVQRLDETLGLYDPSGGHFFLRDENSSGPADVVVRFGPDGDAGWVPIVGDWDGMDGDSIGLYDPASGLFFLSNDNAPGPADVVVRFGPDGDAGWIPIAGNWDGSGGDSIGLYDPASGLFFLSDDNAPGPAELVVRFGPDGDAGWLPVAGNWNGSGGDSIGLYDPGSGLFFLTNDNAPGPAELAVRFGPSGSAGWQPVAGDWDDLNGSSIGLYDPVRGLFFLRNANFVGPANLIARFGPGGAAGWIPSPGDHDGQ